MGTMDAFLSSTLDNVNELITTANNTISSLAPSSSTPETANAYARYIAAGKCIAKGQRSCDKDDFDAAFVNYILSIKSCPTDIQRGDGVCTKSTAIKLLDQIYTINSANAQAISINKINEIISQIEDLLIVANEQMRYYNHLTDLNDKYSEAEKTVSGDVDKKTALLKTSHRRQFYEQQQSSLVQPIAKFLRYFYWVAVFIWVIVLLYRRKYTDNKNIFLTLAFIAFPYISDILIVWAFKIVGAVYAMIPTDAYLNME
jgi:hypothetical protein